MNKKVVCRMDLRQFLSMKDSFLNSDIIILDNDGDLEVAKQVESSKNQGIISQLFPDNTTVEIQGL